MSGGRAVVVGVVAFFAALAQGVVLARLPWWGPGTPDLAALVVVGVALGAGARAGALCGFGTGIALDLLPPADHATGQWAFTLCALGYAVGLLTRDVQGSIPLTVAVGAVTASLAPLGFTLFGAVLGDPRAEPLAALGRLPAVAVWTLVLAVAVVPFARWLASTRVAAADAGAPLRAPLVTSR